MLRVAVGVAEKRATASGSAARAMLLLHQSSRLYQTRIEGNSRGKSRGPPPGNQSQRSGGSSSSSSSRRNDRPRREVPAAKDWSPAAKGKEPARRVEMREQERPVERKPVKVKEIKQQEVEIPLPPFIAVSDLATVLNIRLRALQNAMLKAGHTDTRPDLLLPYSDAEILLLEWDASATPLSTSSASFDIYPRPPAPEHELVERPPVIAIMGHVDHGKTTLLDKLRSASVAAGEAGGITQHVGAFSVQVKSGSSSTATRAITFLDTPGHAAFTKMRGRGTKVTDIVVLVIAADDGVMPQTREVLQLVKEVQEEEGPGATGGLQLLIALSKMDKPDSDAGKVKTQLFSEGIHVEDFDGDVPCVEISGKTGEGLDKLEETLVAISEINELKAERKGTAEGYVIESRVERGMGNTAVVLVKRGALRVGDYLVAGSVWCKVRKLMDSSAKVSVKVGLPGDAVLVTGWREMANAGDMFLGVEEKRGGEKAEELVKRCLESRKRVEERRRLGQDVTVINENRRLEAEEREKLAQRDLRERRRARLERMAKSGGLLSDDDTAELEAMRLAEGGEELSEEATTVKELRLVVRADYSGTVEAVVGAISGIGNNEVKVKILSAGVGEPCDGDVTMAQAAEGQILGFNVKASRSLQNSAQRAQPSVKIHCDNVIYRLMTYVTEQCVQLLPPIIQPRVLGEATIQEVFTINVRSRTFRNVAGCRVTNGTISKNQLVRVLRSVKAGSGGKGDDDDKDERQVVYEGRLDSLKQVKKEVEEMKRGTECGLAFVDFQDFQKGDFVQSYYNEKVERTL